MQRDDPDPDTAFVDGLVLAELHSGEGFPLSSDELAAALWARSGIGPDVVAAALWRLSEAGVIALARWPGPRPRNSRPRNSRPHWVITPSVWTQ